MQKVYLDTGKEIIVSEVQFTTSTPFKVIAGGQAFTSFSTKNDAGYTIYPYNPEYFKALQLLNPGLVVPAYEYPIEQIWELLYNQYDYLIRRKGDVRNIVVDGETICSIEVSHNEVKVDGKVVDIDNVFNYIDGLIKSIKNKDYSTRLIEDFKMRQSGSDYLIDGSFGYPKFKAHLDKESLLLENFNNKHLIDFSKCKDYMEIKERLTGLLRFDFADGDKLRSAMVNYLTILYPCHIVMDYDADDEACLTLKLNEKHHQLRISTSSGCLIISINDSDLDVIYKFDKFETLLEFLDKELTNRKEI